MGGGLGVSVQLEYKLTQHERDEQLMRGLLKYLECGYLIKNRNWIEFRVTKLRDIVEKVIPFPLLPPSPPIGS